MDTQHTDTYTHTPTCRVLRPDAEADGVRAAIVDDPRKDREGDLVPDVGDEFAKLSSSQQMNVFRARNRRDQVSETGHIPYSRSHRAELSHSHRRQHPDRTPS